MGAEVFHTLRKALSDAGHNTNVGDEGGFAPNLSSAEDALDFIMRSIEAAGYKPGEDMVLALDCAATEFFEDGKYRYEGEGQVREPQAQAEYLAGLVGRYPIMSIEDGMSEDDWDGLEAPDRPRRPALPARRRRPLRHQCRPAVRRHRQGGRQLHPDQGEPDRLADRDAGRRRYGQAAPDTRP